jgi:hypothetical protein
MNTILVNNLVPNKGCKDSVRYSAAFSGSGGSTMEDQRLNPTPSIWQLFWLATTLEERTVRSSCNEISVDIIYEIAYDIFLF